MNVNEAATELRKASNPFSAAAGWYYCVHDGLQAIEVKQHRQPVLLVSISFQSYCEALPLTRQVLSGHLQYQQGSRALPAGIMVHILAGLTKTTLSR